MFTIIVIVVLVGLGLYGLARLFQYRASHGASDTIDSPVQGLIARYYHHVVSNSPSPVGPATTAKTPEEIDAAERKYLVKWDDDEERLPNADLLLLPDKTEPAQQPEKKTQQHKNADVKSDTTD